LELFYASGLRLSELAGLDLEDVNLSARMARVLGKGGKQRVVPFNTSTEKALREYLKQREVIVAQGKQGRLARPDRREGQDGLERRDRPERQDRARRRESRARDPLFVNYRGGRLTARSIDRLVRRYVVAS